MATYRPDNCDFGYSPRSKMPPPKIQCLNDLPGTAIRDTIVKILRLLWLHSYIGL